MKERNKVPLFYSVSERMVCYMNYKHQVYLTKASNFDFDVAKRYRVERYETYDGRIVFYSTLLSMVNPDVIKDCIYNTINPNAHYYMGKFFREEVFGDKLIDIIYDKDIYVIRKHLTEEMRDNSIVLRDTIDRMTNASSVEHFLEIFVKALQIIITRNFVMKVYELEPLEPEKKIKCYSETDQIKHILEDGEDFKITRISSDIVYSEDKLSIKYITVSIDLCESSKEKAIEIVCNHSQYLLDRALEACEDDHCEGYVKHTNLPLTSLHFDTAVVTNDCRFVVTLSTKKELK